MKNDIAARETSPVRSLERALHLLSVMEGAGWAMGLTELGRAAQLPKPTVLRLLSVLDKYGFAEKRQGRYRLGPAVIPLAHAYVLGNDLARVSLPVLQELARASEGTASAFVRLGFQRVAIQRVEGQNPLRYTPPPIGQRLPIHLGVGKVLAAAMPPEEVSQMLDQLGDIRLADGEILTRKMFLAQLDQIRRQGYVISCNERMMGAASVGAPVIDASGATIAVASVAGPTDRLTPKKLERLSVEVRGAAKAIADRYDGGSRNG